jgi:hypothetical protein
MPVPSLVRLCLAALPSNAVPTHLLFAKCVVDLERTSQDIIPSFAHPCCDQIVCCDYVWGNDRVRYRHDTLLGELTYDYPTTGACIRWKVGHITI